VANAVAAIRYIQKRYGHVNHIPGLFQGKFEGYDSGNLFRYPTMTYTPATGEHAMIAERRPELLVSGAATARLINRAPLVGGIPSRDYAALGDQFSRMASGGVIDYERLSAAASRPINVYGAGVDEVANKVLSHLRRERVLRGARGSR